MLALLSIALLLVHTSYGQTGCPASTQSKLMSCMGPLQAYLQAGSEAKKALCGQARDGLQCVRDAVGECVSIESTPFQQMLQGFDMIEGQINSNCNDIPESVVTELPVIVTEATNAIRSCSKMDRKTLLRCSRKLQRYSSEEPVRCGRVRRAMDCMTTLLEKCRSKIKPRTFRKVEQLRGNLMGLCVETNEIDEEEITVPPVSEIRTTLRPPPPPVVETTTTIRPPPVNACPEDAMSKIDECMQNVDPSGGQEEVCSALHDGMSCLDDIIAKCSMLPEMESALPMLEQTRDFVSSQCPQTGSTVRPKIQPEVGGNGECPSDVSTQIQECSRFIDEADKSSQSETCSAMNNALQCVNDILDACGHLEEVQTLTRLMNLDNIRNLVRDHCSGNPISPPETGGVTNENCPSDYEQQIQTCAAGMQAASQSPGDVAYTCRVASDGLACLTRLLDDCGGKPEVRIIESTLNMEELQSMLAEQCAPYLGGVNETSVGNDDCPPRYRQEIMDCVKPMETIGELQDIRLMCSEMGGAMDCVEGYLDRCSSRSEIQDLKQAMNFDQITAMVQSTCGGTEETDGNTDVSDTCPSGYLLQLNDCATKMKEFGETGDRENKELACSVARDGLGCLSEIYNKCSHKPEIQSFGEVMNLEEISKMVDKECQSASSSSSSLEVMPNDKGDSSCKYEDPQSQLMACNSLLNKFNDESLKFKKRCRLVFKGFDCFDELTSSCPTNEVVINFTSMVNLDQARGALKDVCSV